MTETCLQCKKPKSKCRCKGGFKILYLFGEPVSAKEIKEINKQQDCKKIKAFNFIMKRTNELTVSALKKLNDNEQKINDIDSLLIDKK